MKVNAKKRNRIICSIILGIICTMGLFIILISNHKICYGEMIQEYKNTDIYSMLNNKNYDLEEDHVIRQEFTGNNGNLYSFSLKFNTDRLEQNQIIHVTLIYADTDEVIQEWDENGENVGSDGYREFILDEENYIVGSQLLAVQIEGDSLKEIIVGSQNDSLGGNLYIDGEEQEGDIAIKLSATKNVMITLVYGIIFCVTIGVLICLFYYFKLWLFLRDVIKKGLMKVKSEWKSVFVFLIWIIAILVASVVAEKVISISGIFTGGAKGTFNIIRFGFVFACLLILCLYVKGREQIAKTPEKFFLVSFLIIGLLFVISMPSEAEISWDESIHYWRAVGLSHALDGKANIAENWLYWHSGVGYSLPNSLENLKAAHLSIQNLYNTGAEVSSDTSILSQLSVVAYLPSAIGLTLGRVLRLPYAIVFHMGAAMNMLLYVVVLYFAMKRLKSGKMILVVVAGTTVSMFLASVYSYDSWITAFSMLGIAYFIGCMQDGCVKNIDMIIMLVSFSLAFMPKPIYFLLFLLYLFLPKEMFETEKKCRYFRITCLALMCAFAGAMVMNVLLVVLIFIVSWIAIMAMASLLDKLEKKHKIIIICGILVLVAVVLVFLVYYLLPSMVGTGDSRGGDGVNAAEQVMYILYNPMEYCKILLKFLKNTYLSFQVEVQGLFNTFGYIGKSSYHVIAFVFLWIVAFTDKCRTDSWKLYNHMRIVVIGINLIIICLIATALYISFNPVASDTIAGCQIRYIMPLMFPFFYCIGFNKIQNEVPRKNYDMFVMLGTNGLLLLNLWQVVIRYYS